MRSIRKIWTIIFAVLLLVPAAWAASFTASLDRNTIVLGESATLTLTFRGSSPGSAPTFDVPGLDINYANQSQSYVNDNGNSSATFSLMYSVTARHTGTFTIPRIKADMSGQTLVTQPITLQVVKPNAPSNSDISSGAEVAFMNMVVPPGKIYVGQQLTVQLRIYLRDDVENTGNFGFTSQETDGFLLGKGSQSGRFHARVGSRDYTVVPLTYAVTVTKSGPVSLGPFTANMIVVVPSSNQQNNDPMRQFFGFSQGEQKQVSMATDPVKLNALPLPEQNKPSNFNGAIGNFTMTVNVGPTNVTVGDPVTVHVQISGHGTFDSVVLPDQSALNGFKIFPPTVKTEASDQLGLDGTKTFEEIVTPQNSSVHEWPQFSFSFFNPDDGQYHTLTQPPIALAVNSAGSTPLPAYAKTATPEAQAPADILPIKQNLGSIGIPGAPLISRPVFVAVQVLPVLALVAALVWRKRTDSLANNPRLRRQRAVAQIISQGLVELKQHAAANKPDEFFATLFRLLQEQLGERLDCPASAITENVIDEHPVLRQAPATTRDGLRELFQLCNQARYAPVRGTSELNSVAAQFEKVVAELQGLKP